MDDAQTRPGYDGSPVLRYPEIDLLRTLAILGMVVYHAAYDLSEIYGWDFDVLHGGWRLFARATAILFLLVSGASNTIANARAENAGGTTSVWRRTIKRSLQITVAALLVTAVTYGIDPETFIRFGILHCIAASVLLLPLFRYFRQWNLLLGITVILLGNAIMGTTADTSLLLPIGIMPMHFISLDYFPLLPWFGVVLMGSAVADVLYIRKGFPGMRFFPFASALCSRISRWSLMVYLMHQPVILLVLMLLLGS